MAVGFEAQAEFAELGNEALREFRPVSDWMTFRPGSLDSRHVQRLHRPAQGGIEGTRGLAVEGNRQAEVAAGASHRAGCGGGGKWQ